MSKAFECVKKMGFCDTMRLVRLSKLKNVRKAALVKFLPLILLIEITPIAGKLIQPEFSTLLLAFLLISGPIFCFMIVQYIAWTLVRTILDNNVNSTYKIDSNDGAVSIIDCSHQKEIQLNESDNLEFISFQDYSVILFYITKLSEKEKRHLSTRIMGFSKVSMIAIPNAAFESQEKYQQFVLSMQKV